MNPTGRRARARAPAGWAAVSEPPGTERYVPIAIELAADSAFEFFPLQAQSDGTEYLVGRPETGAFLAVGAPGYAALRALQEGRTIMQVKAELAGRSGAAEVVLGGFIEQLLNAGFIRRAGGIELPEPAVPELAPVPRDAATRWAERLTTPAAGALYGGLVLLAFALLLRDPGRYLPRPGAGLTQWGYAPAALLAFAIGWLLVLKHEAAHVLAARAAGIRARISVGHRLVFPVLQTRLTALWSVPRRQRYATYLAGMASDVLAGALVVFALAALPGLWPARPALLDACLQLTLLLLLGALAWQASCFMRTDVYYLLADVLRCRTLHADAWAYLRSRAPAWLSGGHDRPASPDGREHTIIRGYALFVAAGTGLYLLAFAFYALNVGVFVATGASPPGLPLAQAAGSWADRATAAALFALVVGIVAWSRLHARRSRPVTVRYRLVASSDL